MDSSRRNAGHSLAAADLQIDTHCGNVLTSVEVPTPMPTTSLQLVTLSLSIALLSGCGARGSGTSTNETRELESFEAIELGGALDLIVHVGAAQKVVISGDDNIVPEIETRVAGGKLHIEHEGWLRPELPLKVEIWVPKLEAIEASGATDIDVENLSGERFELELSGAGDVELRGKLDALDVEISGAGDLDARSLEAKQVTIDLSGAGEAKVWATTKLDVDISGAGEVEYWGNPSEITQDITGAGSLQRR
jgi:hypothetical protein